MTDANAKMTLFVKADAEKGFFSQKNKQESVMKVFADAMLSSLANKYSLGCWLLYIWGFVKRRFAACFDSDTDEGGCSRNWKNFVKSFKQWLAEVMLMRLIQYSVTVALMDWLNYRSWWINVNAAIRLWSVKRWIAKARN